MLNDNAFFQDRCNELDAELDRTREELSATRAERDDALQLAKDLKTAMAIARSELRRLTMDSETPSHPWLSYGLGVCLGVMLCLIGFEAIRFFVRIIVPWHP